jgi:hypothetical protein
MTSTLPESLPALGICLEEYQYPYPVGFLRLTSDLQPVTMAYMDVPPAASRTARRSCSCTARPSAATTSAP